MFELPVGLYFKRLARNQRLGRCVQIPRGAVPKAVAVEVYISKHLIFTWGIIVPFGFQSICSCAGTEVNEYISCAMCVKDYRI